MDLSVSCLPSVYLTGIYSSIDLSNIETQIQLSIAVEVRVRAFPHLPHMQVL